MAKREPKPFAVLLPCPVCGAAEGEGCLITCTATTRKYRRELR